ncbi:hypothetical protein BCV69DRAFT_283173 [Microstroma glucosiphilum]|uniref:U6 snRNA phosphodiesterase 1 n=1 Tax=Pseudomicrostroma glucosiphilum TaxID=1684307 RepID=A0A316U4W0_9BASI|nr:hypothetical protein BCV69DRAFT_283173 [Pseudomicrostroma glucosiphilum]PWN20297.1 hypothetical protein BCV69DRAFT_283173 [Pseudomicrostroma glucosiphilum]
MSRAAATPQGVPEPKTRRALPSVSFSQSPSARTFTSEKIVPGEWLCHVYVAIRLIDYPRLASLLKKAKATLLEGASDPDSYTWFIDGDAGQGEGNLHVSLTQPILVRAHEKDSFLHEARSILQHQSSFALSFSTFAPLLSSPLTSIHPPRVYYTLEVGLGHSALQAISVALGGMVKTFFQGKTYFEEQGARFHASWGYEQVNSEGTGEVSPEQMEKASQRTQKLELGLGDRVRALSEVRVRNVEVKVGKQVTRVPLR